jgi:hypothetical protein
MDFQRKLGQTKMETQPMVKRPFDFFIFIQLKKSNIDKILAVRLERFFGHGIKWGAPSSSELWAWPLRLHIMPSRRLQSYIVLAIFSPFIWTLNNVWPFNSTASQLGRP